MTYTDRQIQILDYVERLHKCVWWSAPDVKLSDSDEFKSLSKIREEIKPTKEEVGRAMVEFISRQP